MRTKLLCAQTRPRFKGGGGRVGLRLQVKVGRPIVCRKLLTLFSFLALAAWAHQHDSQARPRPFVISTISCDLLLIEQSNLAANRVDSIGREAANKPLMPARLRPQLMSAQHNIHQKRQGWRNKRADQRARRHLLSASSASAAISTEISSGAASEKAQLKVAAFASKLDQWLQCQRLNLMQQLEDNRRKLEELEQRVARQPIGESVGEKRDQQQQQKRQATSEQAAASATTTATATQEARPSICSAHFDGHLCWPATRSGQQAQLACPKINYATSPTSTSNSQQEAPHLAAKSVIDRTSEAAAAAIAPIEQDESSRRHPAPNATMAGAEKFARRLCGEPTRGDANETNGQWQPIADYRDCGQSPDLDQRQLFDPTDEWVKLEEDASDRKLFESLTEQLERIEVSIDPYLEPDLLEQWQLCIREIVRQQQAADEAPGEAQAGGQCPIIFDGWRCWPATRAGEVAYVSCPSNQPGFSAERKAHKICTLEGDWYRHPMTNRYWSNYTTCVDTVDLAFRTKILNLYIIGNLISLIALTMSLIIFISFKSLNCTRVTIHKNLFLSFITNNLMWVVWYTYVVNDANLLQSNPLGCRFWHILLHYFLVSNYFWMFCEGLYLHTILVVAFVSEDKILKWFYLLGWLTPIPITLTYAYNRWFDDYYTNFCWMEESPHNIILMAPIGVSLLLNLVFLINIVRVLVTKLRANNSPDTHQTRKAVRATLILIPLLGLHYMLTPFRPEAKSEWEVIYEIIAAVCTSFQGLCVAMLFCFCNGEVITVIEKRLRDSCQLLRPRSNSTKNHQYHQRPPMRSRSNTAVSNVFNYSSHSNHNPHSLLATTTTIAGNCQPAFNQSNGSASNNNVDFALSSQGEPTGRTSFEHSSSPSTNNNNNGDLITLNQHNTSPLWLAGRMTSTPPTGSSVSGSSGDPQQVHQQPHKYCKLALDETTCLSEETVKLLHRNDDQRAQSDTKNRKNNNNNNDELLPLNESRQIVT